MLFVGPVVRLAGRHTFEAESGLFPEYGARKPLRYLQLFEGLTLVRWGKSSYTNTSFLNAIFLPGNKYARWFVRTFGSSTPVYHILTRLL